MPGDTCSSCRRPARQPHVQDHQRTRDHQAADAEPRDVIVRLERLHPRRVVYGGLKDQQAGLALAKLAAERYLV